jgi:glycosyltransferase involved in cell wall biosynthesis
MFSVVILTLNEEKNLPACLASVRACDDIVVLDSGSTDQTHAIARAAGARVVVNRFENFGQQRNFAHTGIACRHEWVFHLDADETFTPDLFDECSRIGAQNPGVYDGFFVAPRMMFCGRWIPRCTDFPAYQARFAHAARFRFVQTGHGQREAPGMRLGKLSASYVHDLSAQSEAELLEKHRRYARQEAAAFLARAADPAPLVRRIRSADPLVRRRALKQLSHHLPARGLLRFCYQYVFRRGFLDGAPGLAYCRVMALYEHWVSQEIRRQRRAARS